MSEDTTDRRPPAAICGKAYSRGMLSRSLYRCTRPQGHERPCRDEQHELPRTPAA